jgi:hypothetical protein
MELAFATKGSSDRSLGSKVVRRSAALSCRKIRQDPALEFKIQLGRNGAPLGEQPLRVVIGQGEIG